MDNVDQQSEARQALAELAAARELLTEADLGSLERCVDHLQHAAGSLRQLATAGTPLSGNLRQRIEDSRRILRQVTRLTQAGLGWTEVGLGLLSEPAGDSYTREGTALGPNPAGRVTVRG